MKFFKNKIISITDVVDFGNLFLYSIIDENYEKAAEIQKKFFKLKYRINFEFETKTVHISNVYEHIRITIPFKIDDGIIPILKNKKI